MFRSAALTAFALAIGATLAAPQAALAKSNRIAFIPLANSVEAPHGFIDMCVSEKDFCGERTALGDDNVITGALAPATGGSRSPSNRSAAVTQREPIRETSPTTDSGAVMRMSAAMLPATYPAISVTPYQARNKPLKVLKAVNRLVNSNVHQETDQQIYGRQEVWHRSGIGRSAVGDCEDIAIEKRYQLIAAGFDPNRLAFAVVYSSSAGLHTVLIARTEKGDMVLDSRSPFIEPWNKVVYQWISVQSMGDPTIWRRVTS